MPVVKSGLSQVREYPLMSHWFSINDVGENLHMSTNLSADQMRELVAKHAAFEFANDWAGALSTMGPTPFYEFYPFRLRVAGADAITDAWSRLLPLPISDQSSYRAATQMEYVNEDSLVHVTDLTFTAEGEERRETRTVVIYRFEGALMCSETVVFDAVALPYVKEAFDSAFQSRAGVEGI
jgi:hypothetical protein